MRPKRFLSWHAVLLVQLVTVACSGPSPAAGGGSDHGDDGVVNAQAGATGHGGSSTAAHASVGAGGGEVGFGGTAGDGGAGGTGMAGGGMIASTTTIGGSGSATTSVGGGATGGAGGMSTAGAATGGAGGKVTAGTATGGPGSTAASGTGGSSTSGAGGTSSGGAAAGGVGGDTGGPVTASGAGGSVGCANLGPASAALVPAGRTRVRVVAANLTSGNLQSYDPGEGIRILQGLSPDVVLLNEAKYKSNSSADLAELTSLLVPGGNLVRETEALPNAIVSRYPVLAQGIWDDAELTDREFVWARLDVPGSVDLFAVVVHLKAGGSSAEADRRDNEAIALRGLLSDPTKVSPEDYVVLGGDFNSQSDTDPSLVELDAIFSRKHVPTDQACNPATNSNRTKPYDHVLANALLDARRLPALVGAQSFLNGLVVDTRVFSPLSALSPAEVGDSGSANMQHMAVACDFAL